MTCSALTQPSLIRPPCACAVSVRAELGLGDQVDRYAPTLVDATSYSSDRYTESRPSANYFIDTYIEGITGDGYSVFELGSASGLRGYAGPFNTWRFSATETEDFSVTGSGAVCDVGVMPTAHECLPAASALATAYGLRPTLRPSPFVASSATQQCSVELTRDECLDFKLAHLGFVDQNGQVAGTSTSFDVSDVHIPYGCQWLASFLNPDDNRFIFNTLNADDKSFNNERDTTNTICTGVNDWCYASYSHRVCGFLADESVDLAAAQMYTAYKSADTSCSSPFSSPLGCSVNINHQFMPQYQISGGTDCNLQWTPLVCSTPFLDGLQYGRIRIEWTVASQNHWIQFRLADGDNPFVERLTADSTHPHDPTIETNGALVFLLSDFSTSDTELMSWITSDGGAVLAIAGSGSGVNPNENIYTAWGIKPR